MHPAAIAAVLQVLSVQIDSQSILIAISTPITSAWWAKCRCDCTRHSQQHLSPSVCNSSLITCFKALWREQVSRWLCRFLKILGKFSMCQWKRTSRESILKATTPWVDFTPHYDKASRPYWYSPHDLHLLLTKPFFRGTLGFVSCRWNTSTLLPTHRVQLGWEAKIILMMSFMKSEFGTHNVCGTRSC